MSKLRRGPAAPMLAAALGIAAAGTTLAKIEPVRKNPSGQEPRGQCQGRSLTEENQIPAGHAPPGQN